MLSLAERHRDNVENDNPSTEADWRARTGGLRIPALPSSGLLTCCPTPIRCSNRAELITSLCSSPDLPNSVGLRQCLGVLQGALVPLPKVSAGILSSVFSPRVLDSLHEKHKQKLCFPPQGRSNERKKKGGGRGAVS